MLGSELMPLATSATNTLSIELPFQFFVFLLQTGLILFQLTVPTRRDFWPGVPLSIVENQLTCLGLY